MYKSLPQSVAKNLLKTFGLIFLLLLGKINYAQQTPSFTYHKSLIQSTDYQISISQIVTGGSSVPLPSAFSDAQNPYLHVIMGQNENFSYIEIDLSMFSDVDVLNKNIYILGSTSSLSTPLINAYVSGQATLYKHVIKSKRVMIPLDYASYRQIGIFSNKSNILNSNNIKFVVGTNSSPGTGPGTGPGPGPIGSYEGNCSNNSDDDKDGLIDCLDPDCLPNLDFFSVVHPTCPICNDGSIRLVTNLPAFRAGCYFSIDGGTTWTYSTYGAVTFSNLTSGNYSIVLSYFNGEGNVCRTTPFSITLNTPPTGKTEACENGGFEFGTFQNWTGGIGTYPNTASLNIPNNNFALNTRHSIIATNPAKNDPVVGSLFPYVTPDGGSYFAKLSDTIIDPPSGRATRLRYRITVNEKNKNFKFWWALISKSAHFDTEIPFNPRFICNYQNITTNANPVSVLNVLANPQGDPFFTFIPNDSIVFRGWTCQEVDLSTMMNNIIEFEFIVTDCSITGHWAYAYIDALCAEATPMNITCSLNSEVLCKGQDPDATFTGTGFNEYRWTVSKLNSSGVEYDTRVLDWKIGYSLSTLGIMEEYLNEGVQYECVDYLFKVDVRNSCNSTGSCGFKMRSSCAEYDIDYCDKLVVFNTQANPIIQGDFDCVGCTYAWQPSIFLQETSDDKEPTIKLNTWNNALNRDYTVKVTTPEGCLYRDTVEVKSSDISVVTSTTYGYCDASFYFTIDFGFPIPTNGVTVKLKNDLTNTYFTGVVFVSETQNGEKKSYNINGVDRSKIDPEHLVLEIEFTPVNMNGVCFDIEATKLTRRFEISPAPSTFDWSKPFTVFVPNVFHPNHPQEEYRTFYPTFASFNLSCDTLNEPADSIFSFSSSIYKAHLNVHANWGGLDYDVWEEVPPSALTGLTGKELSWDGKYNGTPLGSGVYTCFIEIWYCSDKLLCEKDFYCDEDERYFCSDGFGYKIIRFDVTIP